MKKFVCILTALAAAAATLISGCARDNDNSKTAVCFVIANTANSAGLNFNSPLVQETAYNVIKEYGYVSVVNVDSEPEVIQAVDYNISEQYKKASAQKLEMEAKAKTAALLSSLRNVKADDPETDYHKSLALAARSLRSLKGYDNKIIIMLGTGVSTNGVINFSDNLLSADAPTIIELLREREEIIDFSSISVYAQHLADCSAPQETPNEKQKKKIINLYKLFVEAGGGTFIYNDFIPNKADPDADYPFVTPVTMPREEPIFFNPEVFAPPAQDNEEPEIQQPIKEPVIIPEGMVGFIPDKAELKDPKEAENVLSGIARLLRQHPQKILLCGTTAGDVNSAGAVALSQARAEAIKDVLSSMGVDSSLITAIGMGSSNPWHISNAGFEGAAASQNRSVVLLDAASDTARAILGGLEG